MAEKRKSARTGVSAAADKNPVAVNRYAHDVEQARAMRRPLRKQHSGANNNSKEVTLDDVHLGLKGLDEAEAMNEKGELEPALKLYELSLELLIRVLSQNELDGIDKGTLRARVQVGLTTAESIKEAIKAQPIDLTRESPPKGGVFASLSNAISNKLVRPKEHEPKPRQPGPRPTRIDPSGEQTYPSRRSTPSNSPKGAVVSNEIRQSVLDDLFVPASSLEKISWDEIAGLKEVKQSLQETAILPLMRPDLFQGLRKPQNVLLWGPPGTGKTMLVRAVANESGCALFACSASSLTSKWMGEAEKLVKHLFQVAREMAPSIVFVDEIDSLLSTRKSEGEHEASRRLKTEFMVQMDGIKAGSNESSVLVLACTNCPWDIDSAVLRRFPRRLMVPLPDLDARKGLLKDLLKKAGKHSVSSKQLTDLGKRTEGFSCSDLKAIASDAAFEPLRSLGGMKAIRKVRQQDVRPIRFDDFEKALGAATKSVGPEQLRHYQEWKQEQSAK